MKRWNRLAYYLLINVIVSALTTWLVLTIWVRANPFPVAGEQPDTGGQSNPVQVSPPTDVPADLEEPPPGEASPTEAPPTALSAGEQVTGQLEITTVVGAGDLESERVLIKHIGDVELSLANWRLRDDSGNEFTFPALTMFGGGAVTVYTKAGTNTVVELYWGLDVPIWESGETVSLIDPLGITQASYSVP